MCKNTFSLIALYASIFFILSNCSVDAVDKNQNPSQEAIGNQTENYLVPGKANCVKWSHTAQNTPGPVPDNQINGYSLLENSKSTDTLPKRVDLRTTTAGFNRRFEFAIGNGTLYTRVKDSVQWKVAPQPKCLKGAIENFSVDEDELVAIDASGWIYTMDNALSSPAIWNWGYAWGPPFWAGQGHKLPQVAPEKWAMSIISPHSDETFTDIIGKKHYVANSKVTQILCLTGDGSRITLIDPWLPNDYSYEIGGPVNGRFKSVALSCSASTTFVINQYGDMYTRLYDFDISGANGLLHRYSWQDQSNKPEAPNVNAAYFDLSYAAIQLPAPDWEKQVKIPGKITNRISIHATGKGSNSRELRVEGMQGSQTGYWKKGLTDNAWTFTFTGEALQGELLDNSYHDKANETLAPLSSYSFKGELFALFPYATYEFKIDNFDYAATTRLVTVKISTGETFNLKLHTVDALRQTPRAVGLNMVPRKYSAAIELDHNQWNNLSASSVEKRRFVSKFMWNKRIKEITLYAKSSGIYVLDWAKTLKSF